MTSKGKKHDERPATAPRGSLAAMAAQSQLDFELGFFGQVLSNHPNFIDVLRVMGNNLTLKGRTREGLDVDQRLARLRPHDPLAHYNLACSLALLKRIDAALKALRRAVELGYRDFQYMRKDKDLDSLRGDPRYRQLMREFEKQV